MTPKGKAFVDALVKGVTEKMRDALAPLRSDVAHTKKRQAELTAQLTRASELVDSLVASNTDRAAQIRALQSRLAALEQRGLRRVA